MFQFRISITVFSFLLLSENVANLNTSMGVNRTLLTPASMTEETIDDIAIKRWMANYFAVNDFECDFTGYTVRAEQNDWVRLLKSNALKDQRGYLRNAQFHIKFRPENCLYFMSGKLQSKTSDESNGGWGDLLVAHDGRDHRSFVEPSYGGLIQATESHHIRLITNPMHYFCADLDLKALYRNQNFRKQSDLIYDVETYFGQNNSLLHRIRFHLSPEHSFQPKKIELRLSDGFLRATYEIESFKQVDGVWFPVVGRRKLFRNGNPDNVIHESLLEVDPASLRLNQNLKPKDFHFEFPMGSGYLNAITGEDISGAEWIRRQMQSEASALPKYENPSGKFFVYLIAILVSGFICLLVVRILSKRFGLFALLLVVGNVGCGASDQSSEESQASSTFSKSLVQIDQPNRATVVSAQAGGLFSQLFRLKNNTDVPITLGNVNGSCNCLDASLDRDVVPPSEFATLTLKVQLGESVMDTAVKAAFNASTVHD